MKTYNWKEAFEDALQGARAGKTPYQTFVGYCYDNGKGVERDLKMAEHWYRKAARNGNVDAIFNLAVLNDIGRGRSRNPAEAARLYRQAALRGDLQSQSNLAVILLDGKGVKTNIAEGLRWLRRAAQRGDSKAQYNLGRAYANGEDGLRKNHFLALKLLSKAAKQGHAKAHRLLKSLRKKTASSRIKFSA